MSQYALMLAVAAALTASGAALSGEIYKWTDADGNVHYEDRPLGESVERVDVVSRNTNSSNVQAAVDANAKRMEALQESRARRAEEKQEAEKAAEELQARQKKCDQYRARLESYLQSQRLYREDESGERVYLDEEQMLAARAKVQEQIQEYCN